MKTKLKKFKVVIKLDIVANLDVEEENITGVFNEIFENVEWDLYDHIAWKRLAIKVKENKTKINVEI